jgi:hypothetical protein
MLLTVLIKVGNVFFPTFKQQIQPQKLGSGTNDLAGCISVTLTSLMHVYRACGGFTFSVLQFDPRAVGVGFVVDKAALEEPPLPTQNFGFSLS